MEIVYHEVEEREEGGYGQSCKKGDNPEEKEVLERDFWVWVLELINFTTRAVFILSDFFVVVLC